MANEKRITPTDLNAEAERLIAEGKMPKLEDLLGVVGKARQKYIPAIEKARAEEAEESGLDVLAGK
jgi:hypothetical protein